MAKAGSDDAKDQRVLALILTSQQHFANYRYTGIANRRIGDLACLIQLDGREQLGRAPIRIVE